MDAQGNVYVVDTFDDPIQKLSPDGQPLAQWGSKGSDPGQFNNPGAIAVDVQGNIYVVDEGNNRIQKLAASARRLRSAARRKCRPWYSARD